MSQVTGPVGLEEYSVRGALRPGEMAFTPVKVEEDLTG
jgi:hypothetical protein